MAKTITKAELLIKSGSSPSLYVRATVEMPASEYEDFNSIGDLTDAVPAGETSFIAARVAAGTSSGQ
jgi:hypothetical protein